MKGVHSMVYEEPRIDVLMFEQDEIITSSSIKGEVIGGLDDNLDLDAEENQP